MRRSNEQQILSVTVLQFHRAQHRHPSKNVRCAAWQAPARLGLLTAQIGERQGALRGIHLKYHLTTAGLLSAEQLPRYRELRGYR